MMEWVNRLDVVLIALLFGIITAFFLFSYEKISLKLKKRLEVNNSKVSKKSNNEKYTDYSIYKMTIKENVIYISYSAVVLFIIGYIFYQNIFVSILLALFGLFYKKIKTKDLINKRKYELNMQFKQSLYSLSSTLVAGKSVENAFKEVINDLRMLYPSPDTYIIKEYEIINRRFENGEPIENAILDFSKRANIEDISNFADVFITCKRTGGDLVEVIRRTSNIISSKIDTQQEIAILIAQKKLEAKILCVAPFAIVALISFSSGDYMEPLYGTGIGPLIMTISLAILVFSYLLSKWIMDIKV